jgi:2-polyprenyl-6-methoxyphenol hydroxylase-like FAD-dependent oxidoreductase
MNASLDCDVVVVGAGIAGVSLAVGLKEAGLNVYLIEKDLQVRERFRGEFLQPYSVRGLTKLGLGEIFENPHCTRVKMLRFRDLDARNRVLAETTIKYPAGSEARVIPAKTLAEKLRSHARSKLGKTFFEGATIQPLNQSSKTFFDHPKLQIKNSDHETFEINPRWVVGCDGRQSVVRSWLGGKRAPKNGLPTLAAHPEFIMGCEINYTSPTPEKYEVLRTFKQGTVSYFQLTDKTNRIYWNTPSDRQKSGKPQLQSELSEILEKINPLVGFESTAVEKIAGAPADTVWMGPAAKGCFYLAGDALAITTPLGGQGMTCSIKHVEALIKIIKENKYSKASLRRAYMQFALTRHLHHNVLNLGLYYLFFASNPIFKKTTKHILSVWNTNPEMKDRIGRLFGGDDEDTPKPLEIMNLWGITKSFSSGLVNFNVRESFNVVTGLVKNSFFAKT